MEQDRPLRIIDKGQDGYYPNRENIDRLKRELTKVDVAKLRVTVISVSGAMRTGKSTLLNFLLRALKWAEGGACLDDHEWLTNKTELDGFSSRGGLEADTLGVLVWSHPFRIIDPSDSQPRVVLLMDTQGSFDQQSSKLDCAAVFAFSTMFASTQILNVRGNLDENVFDYLTAFTALRLHARPDFRTYQHLVLLIRDWDLSDDLGFVGGRRLLRRKLQVNETTSREARQNRRRIRQSFGRMECCLFPSPGQMAARGNWAIEHVDVEFWGNLYDFVRNSTLFRDKLLGDRTLNCDELVNHMTALLSIFDRSSMPSLDAVRWAMTRSNNNMVLEDVIATYRRELPLRAAELGLNEADNRLRRRLMQQLFERVIDDDEGAERENFGERLHSSLDAILRETETLFEVDNSPPPPIPPHRRRRSQSLGNVIGQWADIEPEDVTLNVCIKNRSDASLKLMRSTFNTNIQSHRPESGMRSLDESSFECAWSWRDSVTIEVAGRAYFSGFVFLTLDGRLEARIFERSQQVSVETVEFGHSGSIMGPDGLELLLRCALDDQRTLWDITVLGAER